MKYKDIVLNSYVELLPLLKKEAEWCLMTELCSIIGINKDKKIIYREMQNKSKNPESYFIIDPYDYLSFINEHECLLIFHSHLLGDESPSEFDKKTSENCCYPFLIYSVVTEKFCIYEPLYKDYDVNIIERLKVLIWYMLKFMDFYLKFLEQI